MAHHASRSSASRREMVAAAHLVVKANDVRSGNCARLQHWAAGTRHTQWKALLIICFARGREEYHRGLNTGTSQQ
jgi:hypothetical protein